MKAGKFALSLFLLLAMAGVARAEGFFLGPGDILEISAWKDEELSRKVLIRPDGFISFPLIGDIKAEGRTVEDLRNEIEVKVKEFVPDTTVSIILLEANSPRMYVVGKVNKPGVFLMMGEPSVVQALAWAGGPTTFAATSKIRVIRKSGDKQQVFRFNYDDLTDGDIDDVDLSTNIPLVPGDTVIVP